MVVAAVAAVAAIPIGMVVAQSSDPSAEPPASASAVSEGGIAPGETVPEQTVLPPVLQKELAKGNGPVVAGFVLPGVNEDMKVAEWLSELNKDPKFSDTKVLVYRITPRTKLKDIPKILDMTSTPVVAVFQQDGKIAATWRGIVDSEMLRQSVIDARKNIPRPITLTPSTGGPYGNSAGISLARKINARYAKIPVVVETVEGINRFPSNMLTTTLESETTNVFQKGKLVGSYEKGTTSDGEPYELITNRRGAFLKRQSMTCWMRSTSPILGDVINQPAFPLQVYRFGKPTKVKGKPDQVSMKIWVEASDEPAWTLHVDRKTSTVISGKRDKVTSTLEGDVDATSTTKNAKGKNPMGEWPKTVPTCASIG